MRLLELHCDYVRYKPLKKALKTAQELSEKEKAGAKLEDCLVVFSCFEEGDDERVAGAAAEEVKKNFGEVKAKTVLVYPYAHLSSNLASPGQATKLLNSFYKKVQAFCPSAQKSVFGYYKEFELKCKGHPLAELSKTVRSEDLTGLGGKELEIKEGVEKEVVSESLKQEEKMRSRFYVLTPKGELVELEKFDFSGHEDLKKFAGYETDKKREYEEEPPHIKLMKEHDLVQYEPASDSGNFRWLPKGLVLKKTLEEAVTNVCVNYGAMQVETPIMYDFEHPALKNYLNRFPARQYVVKSDEKEYFLRFSACFGQFILNHEMTISYKQLPLKMYELTHYSFRREQTGELCGLKRLRAFTMPDMHTLCADLEQAKKEFESQYRVCLEWMDDVDLDFETAFRAQKDFFEENREWYVGMIKRIGKPVLFEIFDERYAYFITKFEFNYVDNVDKASGISTVQIDVENAERFGISFTDKDGKKKEPMILHTSVSGGIDRLVYALLENEARKIKQKKTPMLPVWLAPTQVRIVPVSETQNDYCAKVLEELMKAGFRADFDDREETMQKKVREAEKEWVPFVCVVGEKEVNAKKLSVRNRKIGKQETLTVKDLAGLLEKECEGKPRVALSLPARISQRPAFGG